jgi:rhodanese-related sulfurtransferase
LTSEQVAQAMKGGAVLVDLRSPEAFAGAFIPGSLAIPLDMLPAYAGYLLDYEHDLIFVPETLDQIPVAVRYLIRMGYDRLAGYLKGGMASNRLRIVRDRWKPARTSGVRFSEDEQVTMNRFKALTHGEHFRTRCLDGMRSGGGMTQEAL